MPIWSEVLTEVQKAGTQHGPKAFDVVRRKYISRLHSHTGRNVILYATKFTQGGGPPPGLSPQVVSINNEDTQALMEVVYGLKGPNLDLILHSPGGSLEAAEGFVEYLRSKFDHIRVIVPQMAMSAGTMVACSADEIVLGKHSCLGPIDPQVMLQTDLGLRMVPAQAILEQFARAQRECKDPTKLASWLPMLKQYGPDLLVQCEHASTLSVELVRGWLQTCMFRDDTEAQQKAKRISAWLGDHSLFKTHGRHITRKALREQGMNVVNLEDDQKLQDEVLSIFHATTHTFNGTGAFKIVENQLGRAFVGLAQLVVPQNAPSPQPGPSTPTK